MKTSNNKLAIKSPLGFMFLCTVIILSALAAGSLVGCQNSPDSGSSLDIPPGDTIDVQAPEQQNEQDLSAAPDAQESESEYVIPEVESIEIILDQERFARGTYVTPEIIILPEDAADKTYTLLSDDNSILRRRMGRWTAVGEGVTHLTAVAPNGVRGYAIVTVYVAAESIELGADEITIHEGESASITAEVLPADTTDKTITFASEDESIANVNEDGTVTAVGTGTTTIKVESGDISETVTIEVIQPVSRIEVSADRRTYLVGDEGRFFVRITPDGASDAALTVTLSGDEIVLTGENTFRAEENGDVVITVTAANGVSGSHTISVVDLQELAAEVLRLTNVERERLNLIPFIPTQELNAAAMVRAEEITINFSHTRPDGRDCFTAFAENDVQYLTAGENLAAGHRNPAEVVRGWMESPAHRDNIVNPAFGRMGTAVVMNEDGRLYWTQAFTD